MTTSLDGELGALLTNLSAVQDDLLALLTKKRALLMSADLEGLGSLVPQEERIMFELQECMGQREKLLARAAREGLPSTSVRALAEELPAAEQHPVREQIELARSRARLLKHHSFVNWVVVQRTLIHLSQMLEIIATGGRLQPTYTQGEPTRASGTLVDRAA